MYAELHAKSNFSFLEGASHPDELVRRAADLGYSAIAVTDRNSLAGIVRAHAAAKDAGVKLIVGAEVTPSDALPIVLWAPDRAAYGRLARLITVGHRNAPKGKFELPFDQLAQYAEGVHAGAVVPSGSTESAIEAVNRYRDVFADRLSLLAELHLGPDDRRHIDRLKAIARATGIPLAAANDVHYHASERGPLQDALVAIRQNTTIAEIRPQLFPNYERYLKPVADMRRLFAELPEALERSRETADRMAFSLDQLRYEYPEELAPPGKSLIEFLENLAWSGAAERYPAGIPERVRQLLAHELRLIGELNFEAYFLTVWDLVRFAKSRGILCQGRGSAANSVVCFCLGITSVDPERIEVLFERFVSRERNEAPDIDVDFEHERREEVLQYLYAKYGRERSGMTAEVISYRPRSAVRDLGKALGFSAESVDRLAGSLERGDWDNSFENRCQDARIDPKSPDARLLIDQIDTLIGFPRHLSQHTGGMVMTRGSLCELVPIENAAMPGRTVIEWNKDDLDELGILKVDCLALGMLTAIRKTFDFVQRHSGQALSLASIPEGDPNVYEMICRADTVGVFQIESRAQMSMLPRLKPKTFYDLVIEVAIIRPGPIQGNMVHPYLRRRNGEETPEYPSEAIRDVLIKTLGVPLFQEQAMRLAVVAAGFTPGEADQLRRAMAAWRRPGIIDDFKRRLVDGMTARGLAREFAESVFNQIRGFGDYGFPESHAASFALLVYVSAWLKQHHQAAFTAGLLNSQPMGFYGPAQLVRDARNHGVEVRPADVNFSHWDCTLEADAARPGQLAIRLGFRILSGMASEQADRIVAARGDRPFASVDDFLQRTRLSRAAMIRLAPAGVFRSIEPDRRRVLWQCLAQENEERPLFERLVSLETSVPPLPDITSLENVVADYESAGLSLEGHPIGFLRPHLDSLGVVPTAELASLRDGELICVAGLVLARQRPGTAKGITFVTLEDETAQANLIVRQAVWQRYRQFALAANILLARGRLQNQAGVIHILVDHLENLAQMLGNFQNKSRDFR